MDLSFYTGWNRSETKVGGVAATDNAGSVESRKVSLNAASESLGWGRTSWQANGIRISITTYSQDNLPKTPITQ